MGLFHFSGWSQKKLDTEGREQSSPDTYWAHFQARPKPDEGQKSGPTNNLDPGYPLMHPDINDCFRISNFSPYNLFRQQVPSKPLTFNSRRSRYSVKSVYDQSHSWPSWVIQSLFDSQIIQDTSRRPRNHLSQQ